jgi:DNA polymerase-3 subunit gamma/tau
LEALQTQDAKQVLSCVEQLDERAPDYREVLAELAGLLQKLALLQAVPDLQLDEAEDVETYRRLANALSPEDVQLFYQIAIVGRRDLELAPDARAGFEMVLLRMLAFNLEQSPRSVASPVPTTRVGAPAMSTATSSAAPSQAKVVASAASAPQPKRAADADWSSIVAALNLQGMVRQLAAHCALVGKQGNRVQLQLDAAGEHFKTASQEEKLTQALSQYFGEPVRLEFSIETANIDTPARQQKAASEERMQNARNAIESDPNVRAMRDIFGATIQPESIRPNDPS